jgi:outer membrane lipoprotein-sorting protein
LKLLLSAGIVLLCVFSNPACARDASDSADLIAKMEAAYARVEDYRTRLVITGFGKDHSFVKRQTLLYTFKKPDKFRLDFESPHRGMVVAYPDNDGKVSIRPMGWGPFFAFHVKPESSLLEISPGQQINQTDLGLLIRNIAHSLTDMFLGDLDITSDHDKVVIHVLSDNPFRRGDPTRYVFFVDERLWLPVEVKELSAAGVLRRTVVYENLRLNTGVHDSVFHLD